MSRFTNLLQATLKGISDAFESARTDLFAVVEEMDRAAKQIDPDLTVSLMERRKTPDGTVYALLVSKGSTVERIMFYMVGLSGYPIAYSTSESGLRFTSSVASKGELEQHFESMLTNRSSPLIAAFAFLLR